ncbi:MAG: hypothetical protein AAFU60_12225 [Bacteroidota bacterium]
MTASPTQLERGDRVELIAGNLTGLQGTLIDARDKQQVVIDLERMGYSLRISVDKNLLRKV